MIQMKQTKKILAISAFYRSDEHNGIAISITHEVGDLNYIVASLQDKFDAIHAASVRQGRQHAEITRIRHHLKEIGSEGPVTEVTTGFLIIALIYLLGKYDAIPSDEFNGLLIAV